MSESYFINQDKNIDRMARQIRLIIQVVSLFLLLLFSWLNLQGMLLIIFESNRSADLLFKFAITLYFIAWLYGPIFDMSDMKYIITIAPEKGKLPMMAVGIILMAGFLFAILCYAKDLRLFSLSLLAFRTLDLFGNYYLNKKYRPALDLSARGYEEKKDYVGMLITDLVRDIISGKHIWHRYIFGASIISIMIIFAFTNLHQIISTALYLNNPEIIFSITMLVYVLVHEFWIWQIRLNRHQYIRILERINQDYALCKQ